MALFDNLRPRPYKKQFVRDPAFREHRKGQMKMAPRVLDLLKGFDAIEEKVLRLEFFFYTNTSEKAQQLANEIGTLNYEVQYATSAGSKSLFVITGWTTKMKMDEENLVQWTKQMCDLGYKFDCKFDGWGTFPDQEQE